MKHQLKHIQPPVTLRMSLTITLIVLASLLTTLAGIMNNVVSATLPNTLTPYMSYAWLALVIIVLLGIIVATWQVWYASGHSVNTGTSLAAAAQSAIRRTGQASAMLAATTPSQQAGQATSSGVAPASSVSPVPAPGSAHYHTCVIGYSNKDATFVNKIYTDLQALGVSCLLVDQDLKIGDKLREEIYRAVRKLDKLLLVFSHNAIESKWVEEAVDVALDRERQQPGTYLLFPLRLDNIILDTEKYWAIAVRQRLIGDFTQWQQDAEYQRALQRVLRDLRV